MGTKNQLICAWCGPTFLVLLALGLWGLAGWVPPPSPTDSAEQVSAMFQQDTTRIRLAMLAFMTGVPLYLAWTAAVTGQLNRIEGRRASLAHTQLLAGGLVAAGLVLPIMIWAAAAYRPERSPEATQTLNDLAWIPFLGLFSPAVLQMLAIALVIFADDRAEPALPRWAGYFNVWVAILGIPAGLLIFFKDGPFAWDGVFGFWIPAPIFFVWVSVMTTLLVRAIKTETADEDESARVAAAA